MRVTHCFFAVAMATEALTPGRATACSPDVGPPPPEEVTVEVTSPADGARGVPTDGNVVVETNWNAYPEIPTVVVEAEDGTMIGGRVRVVPGDRNRTWWTPAGALGAHVTYRVTASNTAAPEPSDNQRSASSFTTGDGPTEPPPALIFAPYDEDRLGANNSLVPTGPNASTWLACRHEEDVCLDREDDGGSCEWPCVEWADDRVDRHIRVMLSVPDVLEVDALAGRYGSAGFGPTEAAASAADGLILVGAWRQLTIDLEPTVANAQICISLRVHDSSGDRLREAVECGPVHSDCDFGPDVRPDAQPSDAGVDAAVRDAVSPSRDADVTEQPTAATPAADGDRGQCRAIPGAARGAISPILWLFLLMLAALRIGRNRRRLG